MMRRRRELAEIERILDMAFEFEPSLSVVAKAIEVKKRRKESGTAYWYALDAIEKFNFEELAAVDKELIEAHRRGELGPRRGRQVDIRRDGTGQHLTPVLRAAQLANNRIGLVIVDHKRDQIKYPPDTHNLRHQIYKESATRFKIRSGVRMEDRSEKPAFEIVRDAAAGMRRRQK